MEEMFRIEELSRIWRVSKASLYRRIREGELDSLKMGGILLVSKSQAIAFLEKCENKS